MRKGLMVLSLMLMVIWETTPRAAVAAVASPTAITSPNSERFVVVPAESQVIYRAGEVFFGQNNRFNVAVGTTNAIQGEVWIDRADPRRSRIGTITVNISTFKSDQDGRDNAIRTRWLESARFPTAEFTPTAVHGLPDTYIPGREAHIGIVGNLRIREATKPVTFDATLKLDGNELRGAAKTTILMTDFGFTPPSLLGILKAQNQVNLEFRFIARASG